jgi:hypothetical protein
MPLRCRPPSPRGTALLLRSACRPSAGAAPAPGRRNASVCASAGSAAGQHAPAHSLPVAATATAAAAAVAAAGQGNVGAPRQSQQPRKPAPPPPCWHDPTRGCGNHRCPPCLRRLCWQGSAPRSWDAASAQPGGRVAALAAGLPPAASGYVAGAAADGMAQRHQATACHPCARLQVSSSSSGSSGSSHERSVVLWGPSRAPGAPCSVATGARGLGRRPPAQSPR